MCRAFPVSVLHSCIAAYSRPGGPGAFGWFPLPSPISGRSAGIQTSPSHQAFKIWDPRTQLVPLSLPSKSSPAESSHWLSCLVLSWLLRTGPDLSSCPDFLQWWTMIWKCKSNKSFPLQLDCGHGMHTRHGLYLWAKRCILLFMDPANGC